jgi:hypothetical protein
VHVAICSPIPRNAWTDGKMNRNTKYTPVAEAAAKEAGVDFINLNELAATRYDAQGQQKVTEGSRPHGLGRRDHQRRLRGYSAESDGSKRSEKLSAPHTSN